MLFAAVTVLVVVVTSEPAAATSKDQTTRAMEKALRSALGADAVVMVRRSSGENDAQLATWAASEHANLLGIVTWSEEQRSVSLRFVHPGEGRWADRDIRFDPSDVPAERGRTVGFALASMVPDDAIPPSASDSPSHPSSPPPPPPPSAPSAPSAAAEARAASPPLSQPREVGRWSVEAAGAVAGAVGGFGGGVGGVFGVRYAFAPRLSVRAAFGARQGEVAPALATSHVFVGGAGVAWHMLVGEAKRFGVGVRADALLIGHELVHLSADDHAPDHLFRAVPGADAAAEATWRLVEQAGFFAAFGAETAFGRSDVYVRDKLVAELSPIRLFGEAGIRVSF